MEWDSLQKNDCSVRTAAQSSKCHAVDSRENREKWRKGGMEDGGKGDGEEVECLIRCSSYTKLSGESCLTFNFALTINCYSQSRYYHLLTTNLFT